MVVFLHSPKERNENFFYYRISTGHGNMNKQTPHISKEMK